MMCSDDNDTMSRIVAFSFSIDIGPSVAEDTNMPSVDLIGSTARYNAVARRYRQLIDTKCGVQRSQDVPSDDNDTERPGRLQLRHRYRHPAKVPSRTRSRRSGWPDRKDRASAQRLRSRILSSGQIAPQHRNASTALTLMQTSARRITGWPRQRWRVERSCRAFSAADCWHPS